MKDQMRVIYRLMDDKAYIEKVQKATLTTEQFGVNPTHGLFGSAEWWEKILSGGLPVYTYRGSITKRYMGSMNDWPCHEVAMKGARSANRAALERGS